MTIEELRDGLTSMVNAYEKLVIENLALRAVLQSAVPQPGEPPLSIQVNEVIQGVNENVHDPVRKLYADWRQRIQQAAADHQFLELLKKAPPKGGIN